MSRRGRPRAGARTSFRLPEPVLAALDERARAADISRAEALRTIVEDALRRSDDGVDRHGSPLATFDTDIIPGGRRTTSIAWPRPCAS